MYATILIARVVPMINSYCREVSISGRFSRRWLPVKRNVTKQMLAFGASPTGFSLFSKIHRTVRAVPLKSVQLNDLCSF